MSEVCSDCKGKGTYQGFNTRTEPCSKCNGVGKLNVTKADALKSVLDNTKGAWNNLLYPEDYDMSLVMPVLVTGTPIHVYDAGWNTVFVLKDENDIYEAGNKTETFYIPHNDVVFNMTQNRWECIKSGTPTWH
tara:strand:- start:894 stop:1292 length:399 start_codon:yes stop_codon:yes gene_type:complete